MKTRIIYLLTLPLLSLSILGFLIFLNQYQQFHKNAFVRKLPPFQIEAKQVTKLKIRDGYIAGRDKNKIYIGSSHYKNLLVELSFDNLNGREKLVTAPPSYKPSNETRLIVDSSNLYLMDGKYGRIGCGSILSTKIDKFNKTPYYSDFQPISTNSYIFKSVDTSTQNILVKQNKSRINVFKGLLRKQIDGYFCTDGMMLSVPQSNTFIYVYYYRNQFIVADTNLRQRFIGQTIDTISHAQIQVGRIRSNGQTTLSSPPVFVNKKIAANSEYLFINSALKADNETDYIHESSAPIDVYSLTTGRYILSFYLPDFDKRKLTDFKVFENKLVALFGNYVYTFELNIGKMNQRN